MYDLQIFSLILRLLFHCVDCVFCCTEGFQFHVVTLSNFCFCCLCFGVISKKLSPRPVPRRFSSIFSSRSFPVSGLMFKYVIYFELIFVNVVRQGPSFILLHVLMQFSQYCLLKRLSFPHRVCGLPCQVLISQILVNCIYFSFKKCNTHSEKCTN